MEKFSINNLDNPTEIPAKEKAISPDERHEFIKTALIKYREQNREYIRKEEVEDSRFYHGVNHTADTVVPETVANIRLFGEFIPQVRGEHFGDNASLAAEFHDTVQERDCVLQVLANGKWVDTEEVVRKAEDGSFFIERKEGEEIVLINIADYMETNSTEARLFRKRKVHDNEVRSAEEAMKVVEKLNRAGHEQLGKDIFNADDKNSIAKAIEIGTTPGFELNKETSRPMVTQKMLKEHIFGIPSLSDKEQLKEFNNGLIHDIYKARESARKDEEDRSIRELYSILSIAMADIDSEAGSRGAEKFLESGMKLWREENLDMVKGMHEIEDMPESASKENYKKSLKKRLTGYAAFQIDFINGREHELKAVVNNLPNDIMPQELQAAVLEKYNKFAESRIASQERLNRWNNPDITVEEMLEEAGFDK